MKNRDTNEIFMLMHKDIEVIPVCIDTVTGCITMVGKPLNEKHLPLGGDKTEERLKKWWEKRATPITQQKIQMILNNAGVPTTQSLLVQNSGLSLTDHYWIQSCNEESRKNWKDVSLFENDFNAEQKAPNVLIRNVKDIKYSPDSSLQGELEKWWIIDKQGNRCLVKGNLKHTNIQCANEFIATLLHKKQNKFPYVTYEVYFSETDGNNNENTQKCICKDFATKELEFIPAHEVLSSKKKPNNISEYEHFIDICVKKGLNGAEVRSFLEYLILTDFILTNVDRHYNNFGVLRNSDTLEFEKMAPIFDSGNSLFCNNPQYPINNPFLTKIETNSFAKTERDLLKYVTNFNLVEIEKLPTEEEIKDILKRSGIETEQIKNIFIGYERKIEVLREMQSTNKVFEYSK